MVRFDFMAVTQSNIPFTDALMYCPRHLAAVAKLSAWHMALRSGLRVEAQFVTVIDIRQFNTKKECTKQRLQSLKTNNYSISVS